MDPSAKKPNSIRTLLTILLLLLAVRFLYLLSSPSPAPFTLPTRATATLTLSTDANPTWQSKEFRTNVEFYKSIFQELVHENYVTLFSKSLVLGSVQGQEVLALKEVGVSKVAAAKLNSLLKYENRSFEFVFVGNVVDKFAKPVDLGLEIVRVLKPGGFVVVLTNSGGDSYSVSSIRDLFPSCSNVRSREIDGLLKEIVFRKEEGHAVERNANSDNKCSVPEHKIELIRSAEPLIEEEPLKPWLTLKRNVKNIKYLSSVADISFKRRYIYIDVGARSYSSSIGSWFKKQYPKQNHTFEIFAIEADKAFHDEYLSRRGVNLLPFAAWVRNESISFEVNHEKGNQVGKGMGRIRSSGLPLGGKSVNDLHLIQGFDLAEWLKSMVTEHDFVVMKMDVEGTEFDLIPRLFETGAICLIDELFLECHYNRWQRYCPGERSPKYEHTYGQCLNLFSSLRDNGVLVHQWW